MTRRSHPIAECRWSVPAFRSSLMSDDEHAFERYWLCERATVAVPVTQADCDRCNHWFSEKGVVSSRGRARAGTE
jgi:hypothetical protein